MRRQSSSNFVNAVVDLFWGCVDGMLGLGKRVRLTGAVSVERRERLYREAACCVYTPVREPFGMVPLEAAAAGRPVVATEGGGYTEILTGNAARFVSASPPAVADAIGYVLSNPQRAVKMGRAAQKAVAPHTWDRTAEELLELLRETADATRKRRETERCSPTELGAHYYPWYRAGRSPMHWNENREFAGITDWPVGGPYSSGRRAVLDRHISMVVNAGIDFLVVNWQVQSGGLNPVEVKATEKLFQAVEERSAPLRLAILLVLQTDERTSIIEAIRRVKDDFMPRKPYHHKRGRPLLWYFVNDPLTGFLFQEYQELKRLNDGVHSIATGGVAYNKLLPRHLREFFSGWCLYSPLEAASKGRREDLWRKAYGDLCDDDAILRPFSISPGFDDSHLTGRDREKNPHRLTSREGLRTYEQMQELALNLDPPPDLIVITSFNEFHENTHIEPSEKHGDRYLQSTRTFKERMTRARSVG